MRDATGQRFGLMGAVAFSGAYRWLRYAPGSLILSSNCQPS